MGQRSLRGVSRLRLRRDRLRLQKRTPYFLPPELWLGVCDHLPEKSVSALSRTEHSKHELLLTYLLRRNVQDSGTSCLPTVAALGNLGRLKTLQVHKSFTADARDKDGDTALLCAIQERQDEFAIALANIGGLHVNLPNDDWSPLSLAIAKGRTGIVQALLQAPNIMVNGMQYQNYGIPLFEACKREDPEILRWLLAHSNIDLSTTDGGGRTPLHIAAKNGLSLVVKTLLVDGRVSRTARDARRLTALSYAIRNGHFDVVEVMHAHNISPTFDDLQVAKSLGETFKTSFLSKNWSRLMPTADGYSMMTCAAASGNVALVEAFLPLANEMQCRDALLYSAACGNVGTLRLLLKHVSPWFHDRQDRTPAWYAWQSNHHRAFRLIGTWCRAQNDSEREGKTQENSIVIHD